MATHLRAEALQRASAQAGRHFAVLTYFIYAPLVKHKRVTLRDELCREAFQDVTSNSGLPFAWLGTGLEGPFEKTQGMLF